jgi:hypothetical protein
MRKCPILCTLLAVMFVAGAALADDNVHFTEVSGLTYTHHFAAREATLESYFADGIMNVPTEYVPAPYKPYGVPGIAIFDFDGDGDLDLYVTNGPGAANSLFSNQLHETGHVGFVDVASHAGVTLTDEDSQGTCFGDIDNDGDEDLVVLGFNGTNHLFRNRGDGTFADITAIAKINGPYNSISCAMGDIDNDGLLDILIGNGFDFTKMLAITREPTVHNQPNQLFHNLGDGVFEDVSDDSGIREKTLSPEIPNDLTWSVAMVDFDNDGDVDIFFGNDFRANGQDKTYIHTYRNDGTGHFTDVTAEVGLDQIGGWHGLAFGDLNCDGRIDLFATNMGDYIFFPGSVPVGKISSAWFLQGADGKFTNPGPGSLVTVPTGWGTSITDYDNDGDLDIVFFGGQDNTLFWDESNPGIILTNTGSCSANFTWDQNAFGSPTANPPRDVEGLATGDLDDNGFDDVTTVSGFNVASKSQLAPDFSNPLHSVFDVSAFAVFTTMPTSKPTEFKFQNIFPAAGTLSARLNDGANHNNWVKVKVVGTAGITTDGKANRDGIGAVLSFTRAPGGANNTVTRPILGGSSEASENSLETIFGLDDSRRGMLNILWPGGTKNRVYGIRLGERITVPEIPCSYDGDFANTGDYVTCVLGALNEIHDAGIIDNQEHVRLFLSALRAYQDSNGNP